MKLISWNVNGLRSVCGKGFLEFVKKTKPDILCLQECKLQEEQVIAEQMIPKGYDAYFSFADKKGYSGVATFVQNSQKHTEKKILKGMGVEAFDSEGRFLISYHQDFILYNVYIPSGTTGEERQKFKYRFLDSFSAHLQSLPKAQQRKLIICGDFNICHKAIDIHHPQTAEKRQLSGFLPDERKWMDHFEELGFVDTFRLTNGKLADQYSWWSYRAGSRKKNLGWRIDYFFAAKTLAKKVSKTRIDSKILGSDHCPIVLELDLQKQAGANAH